MDIDAVESKLQLMEELYGLDQARDARAPRPRSVQTVEHAPLAAPVFVPTVYHADPSVIVLETNRGHVPDSDEGFGC